MYIHTLINDHLRLRQPYLGREAPRCRNPGPTQTAVPARATGTRLNLFPSSDEHTYGVRDHRLNEAKDADEENGTTEVPAGVAAE